MNKFSLIAVVLLLFFCCKTSKNTLEINFIEISENAYFRLNTKRDKVVGIDYPIGINFNNSSSKEIFFSSITHWEYDIKSTKASLLYKKENDSLVRISKTNYKKIYPQKNNVYIYYMQQSIKSPETGKQLFKKHSKTLNEEKKINIGSINNLDSSDALLVKKLIEKDSIFIRVKENNKIKTMRLPLN